MNKKEAILKAYNEISKKTSKKVANIELKKRKVGLTDSKLGGVPYLPVGAKFPVDDKGRQLKLLAQINCKDLEGMDDYPQKGLLQFFIVMDDCYGLDNPANVVIYYDEINKNIKEEDILEKYKPYVDYAPFEGEFKIKFSFSEEGITLEDFNFDEIFVNKYNELFPDNKIESFYDLEEEFNFSKEVWYDDDFDNIMEEIYDEVSGYGSKIGGYPYFTQSDPREDNNFDKYDTLLLQIDSMESEKENVQVMWGDSGVCNFFINKEKLKNLDFSDVLYNWDCF